MTMYSSVIQCLLCHKNDKNIYNAILQTDNISKEEHYCGSALILVPLKLPLIPIRTF